MPPNREIRRLALCHKVSRRQSPTTHGWPSFRKFTGAPPVDRLGQHGVVVGVLDVVLETFDLTFGRTDVPHSFSHKVDDGVAVDTIQMYGGGSASTLLI